jgi:endonuclease/exonuclease/phosphatase (EEP) superfamily protein YafD
MSTFLTYFFCTLSVLTVIVTLIPLSPKEFWWIRVFDFPRLQIIGIGLVSLIGYIVFEPEETLWQYLLEAALVVCLVYQAWRIYPYTIFAKKMVLDSILPEDKQDRISIVVTNVLETNKDYKACLKMLRNANPDLILAVETDEGWQENLKELEEDYPYTLFHPLDNTYGMLFYSKLKLIKPVLTFLLQADVPSVHATIELPSGAHVVFHGLHPRPPAPEEAETSVPRDAELIVVGLRVKESPAPTIVAGDLNDVAWSHTSKLFRKTSGLLDPRIGRGLFATFNAKYKLFRWPLDHVFHTKEFKIISLKRLEDIGSDHFPICIHLSYEPETQHNQEKPEADTEDKEEAVEKIEKADEMRKKGELDAKNHTYVK